LQYLIVDFHFRDGDFKQHLRHTATAPQFMRRTYDPTSDWTWAFAGFSFARASFFPEGRRTPEAAAAICASFMANLS